MPQASSGGILNSYTGVYIAGNFKDSTVASPLVDTIELTDTGCIGSAVAQVNVVRHMVVSPPSVQIPPNLGFTFETSEGSGDFECALTANGAGSAMGSVCNYTSGPHEGNDVVTVTDLETGEEVDVNIQVLVSATLSPSPAHIALPVGSTWHVNITGGSGTFDFNPSGDYFTLEDEVITATAPGRETVTATDHFTGLTTPLEIDVIEARQVPADAILRAGDQTSSGITLSTGDINGDGFADAIVGLAEADVNAYNSGAIYVYEGQAGGLNPTPARVFSGKNYSDSMGRSVAVADFDGDGLLDLAVAISNADVGTTDNGAVQIYMGEPGQFFADAPVLQIAGASSGDLLGYALAAADFNGDGLMDLAIGVLQEEDNSSTPVTSDQGAVYIFLGHDTGFSPTPELVRYGKVPDGTGKWVNFAAMKLGNSLAVGDVNGDGLPDLVVGAVDYDAPSRSNDGAVYLYLGVAPSGISPGGITADPVAAWVPLDANDASSNFGRSVAVGDLNGDGYADIVVGQPSHKAKTNSGAGAVRIFAGMGSYPTPFNAFIPAESSDWLKEGDSANDNCGYNVRLGDATGDGILDLVFGCLRDENTGGTGDVGTVGIYAGQIGGMPYTTPVRTPFPGLKNSDFFGLNLAMIDDLDGDGLPDYLVYAGLDDSLGPDVGRPYFVSSVAGAPYLPLVMPGSSSGQIMGWNANFVGDVNGDGYTDLVVGAPLADIILNPTTSPSNQINAGGAWLYLGGPNGFSSSSDLQLTGFTGFSGGDQFGYWIAPAGDFNGDGMPDFAVVARAEDRPSTFDAKLYVNPTECPGTLNDVGAVYLFLGVKSGLPSIKPAFVYYGPQASQLLYAVAGGFDYNGDGRGDLLASSINWDRTSENKNDVGGVAFLKGRAAASTGLITVICKADYEFYGNEASGLVGTGISGMGDLDKDGCDEVAVGASQEDLNRTNSNQGSVRIFYGWGGAKCRTQPVQAILAPGDNSALSGYSVSGGLDVDGDGLPDLAVGAYNTVVNSNAVGAAYLILGKNLATLVPEAIVDDVAPVTINSFGVGTGAFRLTGKAQGELYGRSVALVPNLTGDGLAGLAIGAPLNSLPGTSLAGGVQVFRFIASSSDPHYGLDPVPVAGLGGETAPADSRLGDWVAAGTMGGHPVIVAGAQRSNALGVDIGAAFWMDLSK